MSENCHKYASQVLRMLTYIYKLIIGQRGIGNTVSKNYQQLNDFCFSLATHYLVHCKCILSYKFNANSQMSIYHEQC